MVDGAIMLQIVNRFHLWYHDRCAVFTCAPSADPL